MNNYELLLRKHDLKVTPQRVGILSVLQDAGHISIEDLFTIIRKHFSSISIATLYKNINSMLEVNLVKEVKIPHSKSKYEIVKYKHSHMTCKKCGKVEDIELSLDNVIQDASKMSGYSFNENSLILSGTCPECQKRA